MRFSRIDDFEIVNGEGVGISLFTQGCRFHCKNCFNSELWGYDGGEQWTSEIEEQFLSLANPSYITRISILGGEPLSLENIKDLTSLLKKTKELYPSKKVWVYTGNIFEAIKHLELLKYVDIIVDGTYMDELRDLTLKFRGSSNQRIIDVKKSLQENEVVLLEV